MKPGQVLCVPRDALGALSEVARGGQGRIYDCEEAPATLYSTGYVDFVYKEYEPAALSKLDPDVLGQLVANTDLIRTSGLAARLAWPLALVHDGTRPVGFIMQRAPELFTTNMEMLRGRERRLAELQFVLNGPEYTAHRRLPVTDRWRVGALRGIATMLRNLHDRDIVVGDLSPKNLLVSFRKTDCFFLDCDAMQFEGRSVLPQVETPGWEVPAGEALATVNADAFKFAILATRLFAGSQESRDVTAIETADPRLGALARRGLSEAPGERPLPGEWEGALRAAEATASTTLPWDLPTAAARATASAPPPGPGSPTAVRQPPLSGAGFASTGPISSSGPAGTAPKARGPWIAAGLAAVALLVTVVVGVQLAGSSTGGSTASGGGATSTSTPSTGSTAAPSLGTELVSVSSSAAAQPRAAEVVSLLDRHFRAINGGDYDAWSSTVIRKRASDQSRSAWTREFRSTKDSRVSVSSISDTGSTVDIALTFTSNQNPADAPESLPVSQICWSTTWPAQATSSGLALATPRSGSTTFRQC